MASSLLYALVSLEMEFPMRLFIVLFLFTACDQRRHGDPSPKGDNVMPYCEDVETVLAQDEVSPIGISMDDFLDNVALNYTKSIVWEDGTEGCLSGAINADMSTIRFVESTAVYPEAPSGSAAPSISVECPDHIAFEGYLALMTPDGLLDEELYVTFVISEDTLLDEGAPINATYSAEIDGFDGSFTPAGDFDSMTVSGEVGSVYSGEISVMTTEADGNTALAMREVLAEWGKEADSECDGFE